MAIFYSIKRVAYNFLLSIRKKKTKKTTANSKRSSLNVQAQIVSKQTYLHQKIKTKIEGKKHKCTPPLFKSPLCPTFFHKDDMFAS